MTVEGAKIERVCGAARRAAYPQKPIEPAVMAAPMVGENSIGMRSN
jgi:hypothetical protein